MESDVGHPYNAPSVKVHFESKYFMCTKLHVAKSETGKWVIRRGLRSRSVHSFKTKSEAVKAATELGHSGGFVIIHNTDGQIAEVRHYRSARPGKVRIQSAPVKSKLSRQDVYKAIATVELQNVG